VLLRNRFYENTVVEMYVAEADCGSNTLSCLAAWVGDESLVAHFPYSDVRRGLFAKRSMQF
jgi:hypothetical protein